MSQGSLAPEQILGEIEDVIRFMPPPATFHHDNLENLMWLGRASAAIELWDGFKSPIFAKRVADLHSGNGNQSYAGMVGIVVMLNQARSDLRLKTIGPADIAIGQGNVFDYFDELRKVIELASSDVFFIDPYLDADFVPRYLPHVRTGVPVRLLAGPKRLATLLPAVELFVQQNGTPVSVRSTPSIHDRYLMIDKASCYQSGSSFKDGAKKAPTTLTQITDAFDAMLQTYERLWSAAQVHR